MYRSTFCKCCNFDPELRSFYEAVFYDFGNTLDMNLLAEAVHSVAVLVLGLRKCEWWDARKILAAFPEQSKWVCEESLDWFDTSLYGQTIGDLDALYYSAAYELKHWAKKKGFSLPLETPNKPGFSAAMKIVQRLAQLLSRSAERHPSYAPEADVGFMVIRVFLSARGNAIHHRIDPRQPCYTLLNKLFNRFLDEESPS